MFGAMSGFSLGETYGAYNQGLKNVILNPCGEVNQRLPTQAALTTAYFCDRWLLQCATNNIVAANQATTIPTGLNTVDGYPNITTAIFADVNSTLAIGVADYFCLEHLVEGIYWKMVAQQACTLSFLVYYNDVSATNRIFSVVLRNGANTQCLVQNFTAVHGRWTKITIAIPATSGSGWSYDTSPGLEIFFSLACGSNYTTAATQGVWQSIATILGTTTQYTGFTSSTSNYIAITGIQLEASPVATVFENRPFPTELYLCQRYYENTYAYGTLVGTANVFPGAMWWQTRSNFNGLVAGTLFPGLTWFKTPKRATPTVTLWAYDGTINAVYNNTLGNHRIGCTAGQINTNGFSIISADTSSTNGIALDQQMVCHYAANADY